MDDAPENLPSKGDHHWGAIEWKLGGGVRDPGPRMGPMDHRSWWLLRGNEGAAKTVVLPGGLVGTMHGVGGCGEARLWEALKSAQ